jgi:hypothetical protein
MMVWAERAWSWVATLGTSLWFLLPVGAVLAWAAKTLAGLLLEILRERRKAKEDQRKAAIEFVHIVDEYRRYWVDKHHEDLNAQPDPDPQSMVEWSGDPFNPLLKSDNRALHVRLSPSLRAQAYALNHRVAEAKGLISSLSEYSDWMIDYEAPIIVCEIAIASDDLYNSVLREAVLKRPDEYDAISDIKSKLIRYRNDKEEALNKNRLSNERLGWPFPEKGAES